MANQINIQVGADIKNFQAGMGQAVDTMKQAGAQMESVSSNVSQNTEKTFKNLQQAYRTTAKDAQVLAMTLGTDSQAFQEAAAKAAMYRDQLDDVQDAINAYHPEKKWQVTADVIGGAANVAQGFVGALQLIGVESMNAEKAITTMLALNGIAQAAQSVEALKGAFIALSGSMQLALGAVALLGAAYLVYNSYESETEETNKRLADSFKAIADAEQKVTDVVQETQDLRVKAMKEGSEKRRAEAELEYDKSLKALVKSYQDETITDETYRQRKSYLWQIYQNKLAEISDKTTKKIAKQQELIYKGLPETQGIAGKTGLGSGGTPKMPKLELQPIDQFITGATEKFTVFQGMIYDFAKTFEKMRGVIVDAAGEMAYSIGRMMAGENIDLSGLAVVADLMNTVATATLALGTAYLAAGNVGMGAASIAAGLALKTAAGFVSAKAGGGGSGGGGGVGGGYQSNYTPFSPSMGGNGQNFSFDGVVRGSNLEIVLINTNNQNRRIR
jgi:hypothetical protein